MGLAEKLQDISLTAERDLQTRADALAALALEGHLLKALNISASDGNYSHTVLVHEVLAIALRESNWEGLQVRTAWEAARSSTKLCALFGTSLRVCLEAEGFSVRVWETAGDERMEVSWRVVKINDN